MNTASRFDWTAGYASRRSPLFARNIVSTSHPLVGGGVNANRPSVAVDLNETSLENAVIQISGWTDERGLLIAAKPIKAIVPPSLMFVIELVYKADLAQIDAQMKPHMAYLNRHYACGRANLSGDPE